MRSLSLFRFLFLLIFLPTLRAADPAPFEIVEGDRVLLLGDTLLERENTYGYLETRMHEQFPDRHFTVRNLSWAGDTPRGVSRASFDGPDKGWERLKESIAMVKPSVVFLGYGMAASLQEMTDRAQDITLNPDPTRYGSAPYSVVRFKKELGELMDAVVKIGEDEHRTSNIEHRTSKKEPPAPAKVPPASSHTSTFDVRRSMFDVQSSPVRFVLLSPIRHEDLRAVKPGLPDPAPYNALLEQYSKAIEELAKEKGARFVDLRWPLIKHSDLPKNTPSDTHNGIHLSEFGYVRGANWLVDIFQWNAAKKAREGLGDSLDLEKMKKENKWRQTLRAAVLKKNELFFHRFRPENATYLFGFRKHEQGQNAKEIPMFDPLIEQAEAEIDRLKKPGAVAPKIEPPKPDNTLANADRPPLPDFTVQDGYQITLWAENPLLEKPTQMNWDAQGRLWVCSSSLYPQIEPGQPANDKILILEDTDRDGKADKSSVFAEGLLIPTAVVPDFGEHRTSNIEHRTSKEEKTATAKSDTSMFDVRRSMFDVQNACYVGQSTELLRFEDTDGDGKADTRRVVFSGFGTEDTHHIIHTLKWGPDGRLYFNQSIYIHSNLETPWGMVRLNSGGIFAYDPRTERVEVLFKGLCNPWGHAWDQWGQSFMTDGAGGGGINWGVPGAMYFTYENGRKIMPSISPGSYPKFCALELVHSPMFPDDWQGNAITNDFRAHRIVRFAIDDLSIEPHAEDAKVAKAEDGKVPTSPASEPLRPSRTLREATSGYVTREMPDLVRTNDQSFRPIDVRHGPDGALYVADWSNPVINHGEVDFRDPRRDHHMGRIWRISRKDAPPVKWEPLLGKTNAELLEKLLSKSAWEQEGAKRVIFARMESDPLVEAQHNAMISKQAEELRKKLPNAIPEWDEAPTTSNEIRRWLAKRREKGVDLNQWGREAVWLEGQLWVGSPHVTAMFLRSIPRKTAENLTSEYWQRFLAYPPRVRLEAMRALSRIPTAESAALVLEAALNSPGESGAVKTTRAEEKGGQFDKPAFSDTKDPYYGYAAWLSINDLAKPWTDAIASGAWQADTAERAKQLEWGLKAIDPALAGATLSRLVTENKVPLDGTGPWIELLGQAGGPKEIDRLWTIASDRTIVNDSTLRILAALADAAKLRGVRPTISIDHFNSYLAAPLAEQRGGPPEIAERYAETTRVAARLAGAWKVESAVPRLVAFATGKDDATRNFAFEALREIGSEPARAALRQLAAAPNPPPIRGQAVASLAALDLNPALTFDALAVQPAEDAALNVWRGVLSVKDAADKLAASIPKEMPKPVATAGLRAAREAGKPGAKLLAALTPLAGMTDAEAKMPKDFKALAGFAKQNGDPARGEIIYRRLALGCTVCHAIGGAGGKVGPDMTSIGASAPLDYIIESVIAPAVKVKEGYNAVTLALKDGTQATGIQARETAQEVFLRDVVGKEQAIAKAQITGTTNVGSIMPAGMTDALQDRERLDLFAFLGELGKPGPYDASKGTVARVWKLFSGADAPKVIGGETPLETAFPGYTLVDGRFVKELLEATAPLVTNGADTLMAVTQFQATGGKTRLKITGAGKVWLDGKPLALSDDLAPELTAGVHTLAVKLDMRTLPEYLRAESPDARFLGN